MNERQRILIVDDEPQICGFVSLVLRDAPNVSDEKRAAVTKAAEEIGYRPNAVARSLVRRRSYLIGVMVRLVFSVKVV